MTIELKKNIMYGPVRSRRLGLSLGINLSGFQKKLCSYDCLYCQYGRAEPCGSPEGSILPSLEEVEAALNESLSRTNLSPRFITFSGNGEPTLHPEFPEMVDIARRCRDRYAPDAKVALLSNATRVNRSELGDALNKIEMKILKLDVGNSKMWRHYNRPAPEAVFEEIIEALSSTPNIVLQALFTTGPAGNGNQEHIEDWVKVVETIKPQMAQIYSLDRPAPEKELEKMDRESLRRIRKMLESKDIQAEVY